MSEDIIERGRLPAGLGPGCTRYIRPPMGSMGKASLCPICGKYRTPKTNHAKCSKKLQKLFAEENQ